MATNRYPKKYGWIHTSIVLTKRTTLTDDEMDQIKNLILGNKPEDYEMPEFHQILNRVKAVYRKRPEAVERDTIEFMTPLAADATRRIKATLGGHSEVQVGWHATDNHYHLHVWHNGRRLATGRINKLHVSTNETDIIEEVLDALTTDSVKALVPTHLK